MANPEKVGVVLFILVVLGGSYIAAVHTVATDWLIPATIGYMLVAALLVVRLLTEKENE